MYPPIPLLQLSLHKIRREEADVIAILPWWPRMGWFPLVLSLLVDLPVLLSARPSLLRSPQGLPHPGLRTLRPAAWRLSGKPLQAAGVSQAATQTICAGKRQSMRDLYDSKWRNFCRWCTEESVEPLHPTPQQVLDYLEHLADIPLSHNTILTHVSALSSCTYGLEGVRVGLHPLVSAWVLGHKARHPPVKLRVPPWDLQSILVALGEKKFEPLREIDMHFLTYKTLFLVALASARRISELPVHALSVEPPFLIENHLSFNLAVNQAFWPKTNAKDALDSDIELKAFIPHPSSKYERFLQRMCPVRALKIYLDRTREVRGQNRAVFIHFDPAKAARPVSKATLGCFLTAAIQEAYVILSREEEVITANPHSVRGVAATWAEFARVPPEEICRAAMWKGPCSFACHYRLDLGKNKNSPNFATQLLIRWQPGAVPRNGLGLSLPSPFLALLCATAQQSYCHHAGVRRPSVVRKTRFLRTRHAD